MRDTRIDTLKNVLIVISEQACMAQNREVKICVTRHAAPPPSGVTELHARNGDLMSYV